MYDSIKAWVKEHKKGIFITCGLGVVVGAAVFLVINEKKVLIPVEELVEDVIAETQEEQPLLEVGEPVENLVIDTFRRAGHLRRLPKGYRASLEKHEQMAAMGEILPDGYTYVNETDVHHPHAA